MILIITVGIVGALIGGAVIAALSAGKTEDLESELIGLKAELKLLSPDSPVRVPVRTRLGLRWRNPKTGQWVKRG